MLGCKLMAQHPLLLRKDASEPFTRFKNNFPKFDVKLFQNAAFKQLNEDDLNHEAV